MPVAGGGARVSRRAVLAVVIAPWATGAICGQSAVVNIVKFRVRCKMSDKKNAY